MLARLYSSYTTLPYLSVVTAVSAFLVIAYTFRVSWIHPILLPALTLIVLVFPAVLKRASFWFATAAMLFLGILYNWYPIDNHQWLIALWTFVLGINLCFLHHERIVELLAKNAVIMLALIMLISIVQKSLESEYLSGDLFTYTLLVHEDLVFITSWCPEVDERDLLLNRESLYSLLNNERHGSAQLATGPCVNALGTIVTYWVFLTEALVGMLLLIPRRLTQFVGHLVHIHFIVITYLAVPVVAFGSLLSALGIAATHKKFPRLSFIYFLLLFLLILYILPFEHVIAALVAH